MGDGASRSEGGIWCRDHYWITGSKLCGGGGMVGAYGVGSALHSGGRSGDHSWSKRRSADCLAVGCFG